MEEDQAVKSLAALAQALRLRLFRTLVVAGPEGLTPGVLAEQLEVASNTLSFHLKELMHAGLVTQERQGRNLVYRAPFHTIQPLPDHLTHNPGRPAPPARGGRAAGPPPPRPAGGARPPSPPPAPHAAAERRFRTAPSRH